MLSPEILAEKMLEFSREIVRQLPISGDKEMAAQNLAGNLAVEFWRWLHTNTVEIRGGG